MSLIASIFAICPNRCTGMIALVFVGDLLLEPGRIDVEGPWVDIDEDRLAPSRAIEPAVAKNVNVGQITSSPGLIPIAIREQSRASVPLVTPIACFVPQYAARFFSNFLDVRAQDQRLPVAHFVDRPADFVADRQVLRLQVEQFHAHGPERRRD